MPELLRCGCFGPVCWGELEFDEFCDPFVLPAPCDEPDCDEPDCDEPACDEPELDAFD